MPGSQTLCCIWRLCRALKEDKSSRKNVLRPFADLSSSALGACGVSLAGANSHFSVVTSSALNGYGRYRSANHFVVFGTSCRTKLVKNGKNFLQKLVIYGKMQLGQGKNKKQKKNEIK